jgi:hypothetical protein
MLDDDDFALASAVDTSVVVLEELSLHPQPEVREAVAHNPRMALRKSQAIARIFTILNKVKMYIRVKINGTIRIW